MGLKTQSFACRYLPFPSPLQSVCSHLIFPPPLPSPSPLLHQREDGGLMQHLFYSMNSYGMRGNWSSGAKVFLDPTPKFTKMVAVQAILWGTFSCDAFSPRPEIISFFFFFLYYCSALLLPSSQVKPWDPSLTLLRPSRCRTTRLRRRCSRRTSPVTVPTVCLPSPSLVIMDIPFSSFVYISLSPLPLPSLFSLSLSLIALFDKCSEATGRTITTTASICLKSHSLMVCLPHPWFLFFKILKFNFF